jgi:acetylornithine deacetylase/succinyl-diaminopimelate desuccinylase-like protein
MNDALSALSIARDLLRCPSVTPADAGALGVLETILKAAGFEVHRVTFGRPAPPISTISTPASAPRRRTWAYGVLGDERPERPPSAGTDKPCCGIPSK